jgi:glycerophosphoryl diester phosphodiesterase
LANCVLKSTEEGIPTLAEVLSLVQGKAPLLIEIKDQDGAMGPTVGPLEEAAVTALEGYTGACALMSFNPHSVAHLADCAPHIPRGLVTSAYREADWPLPPELCKRLRQIDEIDRIGASFISHEASDLSRPRVAELKAQGVDVLCWTIRSPEAEAVARRVAQNVTFEGYLSEIPG